MDRYQYTDSERKLLETMEMPFAVYQFIGQRVVTLLLSRGFLRLFEYDDPDEAYYDMDHNMYKDTHPDDIARIADHAIRFAQDQEDTYEVVYRTKKKDGSGYRVIHALGKHMFTDSGVRLAHVWYTDEGTYLEASQFSGADLMSPLSSALRKESLIENYHYDYLTGLPNMTYFFDLAIAGKDPILKRGENPVLLFLDLSNMKFYNQTNGFAEGDRLLRSLAAVLVHHFSNENCSRFSQDHFAVYTTETGLKETLNDIFRECRELNDGNSLPLRVGICPYSMESSDISAACDYAKIACDSIRGSYTSGYAYYDDSLRNVIETNHYITANLDKAIENGWIKVFFQPIVRAVSGKICDEEALSRWVDPKRGFLSPASFIPCLEEAGIIYKLDLYVLEEVLRKLKKYEALGLPLVPQSINLSRSDFDSCEIVEEIRRRVDEAGVPYSLITIEITESVIGRDFAFMKTQIERFRELGFQVWMDDFGSGYSSLEVLRNVSFDLIKLDMGFLQKLDENDNNRVILTEVVKMISALGIDTVCEGVETEEQVEFLRETGCSKLQGYYYSKPLPLSEILERKKTGFQIGYENTAESGYLDAVGRLNLHDLAVISNETPDGLFHFNNSIPMAIIEMDGDNMNYTRSNLSYREFMKTHYSYEITGNTGSETGRPPAFSPAFIRVLNQCRDEGTRIFFDEEMPDGFSVHSFVRRIGVNPVNGKTAVAEVILSVKDPDQGMTYAEIARALAADYYNIYCVNLANDHHIEYSSPEGGEDLAVERHGTDFFTQSRNEAADRVYPDDLERFNSTFTKEAILQELAVTGKFTRTYRLMDTGEPVYVNMKIIRPNPEGNHIIIGVNNVDAQMKQKVAFDRIRQDQITYARLAALSGNFIALYMIDSETGTYRQYSSSTDYETLGIEKEGSDFFEDSDRNVLTRICPDDLPLYREKFSRDNVLKTIAREGLFKMKYRLLIDGRAVPVYLRAALVPEEDREMIIVGVSLGDG